MRPARSPRPGSTGEAPPIACSWRPWRASCPGSWKEIRLLRSRCSAAPWRGVHGMNRSELRVVVADDDEAVREAVADLIRSQWDLELVGTADNHEDLVKLVADTHPDVALMDVRMPRGSAWTTVGQIRALRPGVAVLAISAFDEPDDILAILASGAAGYLVKGSPDH